MKHAPALVKRANLLLVAVILAVATLAPTLLRQRVSAYGQPTQRSIDISTSEPGATGVAYTVSFRPTVTGDIYGIIVDFCTSPLVGTVCTASTATAPVLSSATIGTLGDFAKDTGESTANKLVITDADGYATTAGTAVTLVVNNVTNPTNIGSFYARILTFSSVADAQAYDSGTTGSNNPPSSTVDAGGVALSTNNQLTVNARVQEVLVFCVGTDDREVISPGTETNDCADISGTTVDLGVVQAGTPSISPVATTSGGNDKNGLAMVRTNGVNGVVIDYFAEAVTGDLATSVLPGSLKVSGATCAGTGLLTTGSKTDQCFNNAGLTRIAFATTDEGFGMTVDGVLNSDDGATSNGTTANLVRDEEYCGNGTNSANTGACAGGGWAWSESTTDTIASSTGSAVKVVDDELLTLRFAAQAAVTTPTGQYGVTSTYVATASY